MSASKWKWTEECDMSECCGECDLCSFESEEKDDD